MNSTRKLMATALFVALLCSIDEAMSPLVRYITAWLLGFLIHHCWSCSR